MGLKARARANSSAPKTVQNEASVEAFLETVTDEARRRDSKTVLAMMQEISGEPPRMWGASIVGFGTYHYRYATGREGDWMRIGFSPRKQALTIYCMAGYGDLQELLAQLGRVKHSVSCLYLPDLKKVDQRTLRKIFQQSWTRMAELYPKS